MYGLGLMRGLAVTMKNMLLPSRMFTSHQYPSRRVGILGLASRDGRNPFIYALSKPKMALKAMMGLVTIEDRFPQHPRFRGQEFTWYEERCTGCASCAKYCPLGIIRIVTHPSGEAMQEGENYSIDVFDIDIGRCMYCGLCVEAAGGLGYDFLEQYPLRNDFSVDARVRNHRQIIRTLSVTSRSSLEHSADDTARPELLHSPQDGGYVPGTDLVEHLDGFL